MKKLLALGVVLALSTSMTLAANNYGKSLKNAIKQDIQTTKVQTKKHNQEVKEAIKKDMEAKAKANEQAQVKAAKEKKAQKLKEVNSKITELNKEKASINSSKEMTNTEKLLRTRSIDRQLEYYNKQKDALK